MNARVLLCYATLLAIAGASPPAGAQSAEFTLATVNNMNHLPEFVAVDKGFFAKHGVDVKVKVYNSGAETMRVFRAGEAQFISCTPTTLAGAANAGLKLTAFVQIMGDPTRVYYDDMLAITARQGSGIRADHVEDLSGKRVGMVMGGTGESYLRSILTHLKISANRLTFVNVSPPEAVSALRSGSVDAEATWEPYGTMLTDQVPGSYNVSRGGGYLGYSLFIAAASDARQRNPDVIQRVVDGLAESEWFIRHNHAEAAEIGAHWIEGLDKESARKAIAYLNFDPRIGRDTFAAAENEQSALIALGRIKTPVNFAQVLDAHFIDQTKRTRPEWFNDLK